MRLLRTPETVFQEAAARIGAVAAADRLGAIVGSITDALDLPVALVAEARDDGDACRVVAFSDNAGLAAPQIATAPGTAWAHLLERGSLACPADFRRLFPEDAGLAALGVESLLGRSLRDPSGRPLGIIAVMDRLPVRWDAAAEALVTLLGLAAELEISRQRSENAISCVAREWTATVDAMPDFVAVIDRDFRLRRVNRALARFASCHPRELLGRKCHEVFHGSPGPREDCPHERALRTGAGATLELNDPHLGVPMLVTCTPFFDAGGRLVGTVHVCRDISEQRRAAKLREELIAELRSSLARVKVLSSLLPICASCKKIRDDDGYWEQVDVYLRDHVDATFSHGICPECAARLYPGIFPRKGGQPG